MSVARMLPSPVLSSSRPCTCSIRIEPSPLLRRHVPVARHRHDQLRGRRHAAERRRTRPRAPASSRRPRCGCRPASTPPSAPRWIPWSARASRFRRRRSCRRRRESRSRRRTSSARSSGVPVTVKRFSSRVMCPCESTTTQPARLNGRDGSQGQGRQYRFHTPPWTGSALVEFESEHSGHPGLDHPEVPVEHHQVGHRARRQSRRSPAGPARGPASWRRRSRRPRG